MGEMVAEESVQSTGAMMAKVNKRCELASVKGIGTPAQVDEGVVVKFTLGISRTVTVIWFVSSSPPPVYGDCAGARGRWRDHRIGHISRAIVSVIGQSSSGMTTVALPPRVTDWPRQIVISDPALA